MPREAILIQHCLNHLFFCLLVYFSRSRVHFGAKQNNKSNNNGAPETEAKNNVNKFRFSNWIWMDLQMPYTKFCLTSTKNKMQEIMTLIFENVKIIGSLILILHLSHTLNTKSSDSSATILFHKFRFDFLFHFFCMQFRCPQTVIHVIAFRLD